MIEPIRMDKIYPVVPVSYRKREFDDAKKKLEWKFNVNLFATREKEMEQEITGKGIFLDVEI